MSEQRSSSGVRNLRAMFEGSEDDRGRSPTGSHPGSQSHSPTVTTRKVRTSFVSVEPSGQLSRPDQPTRMDSQQDLKTSATNSGEREGTIQEHAVAPPVITVGPNGINGQSEHPDKSISSVEDQDAVMRPSNVTDATAVSGGAALSEKQEAPTKAIAGTAGPVAAGEKPIVKATKAKAVSSQPSHGKAASTPASAHAVTSKTTAASQAKTSGRQSIGGTGTSSAVRPKPKSPTRPVQISSHLTAPTAASQARQQHEKPDASKASEAGKKVRELPAHLLAPTLSSRAKHDDAAAAQASASAPKPATKPVVSSRSSLGPRSTQAAGATGKSKVTASSRSSISSSSPSASKAAAPPTGEFLSRMTKPTTASNHKNDTKPVEEKAVPKPAKPAPSKPSSVRQSLARSGTVEKKSEAKVEPTKPTKKTVTPLVKVADGKPKSNIEPATKSISKVTASSKGQKPVETKTESSIKGKVQTDKVSQSASPATGVAAREEQAPQDAMTEVALAGKPELVKAQEEKPVSVLQALGIPSEAPEPKKEATQADTASAEEKPAASLETKSAPLVEAAIEPETLKSVAEVVKEKDINDGPKVEAGSIGSAAAESTVITKDEPVTPAKVNSAEKDDTPTGAPSGSLDGNVDTAVVVPRMTSAGGNTNVMREDIGETGQGKGEAQGTPKDLSETPNFEGGVIH